MPIENTDVVRVSVARQIADRIRAAILDGSLKIDERLPTEEDLAKSFGISRPTVREALKRLAAQNLIRSRRGPAGGTFVSRPDPEGLSSAITGAATLLVGVGAFNIDEIMDARLETEMICIRFACQRRDEADLEAMRSEVAFQRKPDLTDEAFCASDVRFHRALVKAARNGPLDLMMYTVVEAFVPVTNMIVYDVRERGRVAGLHERLVNAIDARKAKAAGETLAELLAYLRDSYELSLKRREKRGLTRR